MRLMVPLTPARVPACGNFPPLLVRARRLWGQWEVLLVSLSRIGWRWIRVICLSNLLRESAAELCPFAGHKHEAGDDGRERLIAAPHTVPPVEEEGVPRVGETSRGDRFRCRRELIMREGRPLHLLGDAAAWHLHHGAGDDCWRGGTDGDGIVLAEESCGRGAH